MAEKDIATKDERDLFTKIEHIEEDVAEENPPQDVFCTVVPNTCANYTNKTARSLNA